MPSLPPCGEDRAVGDTGGISGGFEVAGKLQGITHSGEDGGLYGLKPSSGADKSHFCAAREER